MRTHPLFAAAVACVLAAPAAAHEYWLRPSRFAGSPGDTVNVEAWVGTGFRGERRPWAAPRALRLDARDTSIRDLKPGAVNGETRWAALTLRDAGGLAIAYQGDFAFIEMPGREFEAYLALEGLDAPRRARAAAGRSGDPGRERYARCARTWIAGTDPARITASAGLTLEVVPERDPAAGGALPVRVLLRGQPLAGTLVRAWCFPFGSGGRAGDPAVRDSVGPVFSARTDANGRAVVPVQRAGEWLIGTVHMEPSTAPREADWQSWWGSLTFARAPKGRGR